MGTNEPWLNNNGFVARLCITAARFHADYGAKRDMTTRIIAVLP